MKQVFTGKRAARFDHDELTKSSFWVGQFFVVAATIVGVYLAAAEGLNQALTYDFLSSQTDNYHLQRSLADEFRDNLQTIQEFQTRLNSGQHIDPLRDDLQLDLFIWETMKFSKATMETPSQILTGVRRTYRSAETIADQVKARKISLSIASQRLGETLKSGTEDVLPQIEKSFGAIEQQLKDAGVTL